jgi:hypothetical protein
MRPHRGLWATLAVGFALATPTAALAERLLPLGPTIVGGRNAGCQVITPAEARAATGRKASIAQYDAGNLFICSLGRGLQVVEIGVFDEWYSARWYETHNRILRGQPGTTVTDLHGLGKAALKHESRTDGRLTIRQVLVRLDKRSFRVTVLSDVASFPQLIRVARIVARRLD